VRREQFVRIPPHRLFPSRSWGRHRPGPVRRRGHSPPPPQQQEPPLEPETAIATSQVSPPPTCSPFRVCSPSPAVTSLYTVLLISRKVSRVDDVTRFPIGGHVSIRAKLSSRMAITKGSIGGGSAVSFNIATAAANVCIRITTERFFV
jgi:hypothetical protein